MDTAIQLKEDEKRKKIMNPIKKRKLDYLDQVITNQKYEYMQLIVEEKMEGARRPERHGIFWLKNC